MKTDSIAFELTAEQLDMLQLILSHILTDLKNGSAGNLAKTIAASRVESLLDHLNDITG